MTGNCRNCGAPLPSNAPAHRKYCANGGKCRVQFFRRKRSAKIKATRKREELPPNARDAQYKEDPSGLPDDLLSLSQAELIRLPTHPSIIRTLLDAKLKIDMSRRQIHALEQAQQLLEERHLDPDTARTVARYLAKRRYAS